MPISNFKKNLDSLKKAVDIIISKNIDITKKPENEITDFKERKQQYVINNFLSSLNYIKSNYHELDQLIKYNANNQKAVSEIKELISKLDSRGINEINKTIKKIIDLTEGIDIPKEKTETLIKIPKNMPDAIKPIILADLKEIEKCYNAECYRSAAILCGRVLEAALHRKYYEVTGYDILEKNPGIGLGKLIAKLDEKNVKFEPGLTQQIHLVNQLRIFSVHIKQETFYPSKNQTQAMILYTLDVLDKIFRK